MQIKWQTAASLVAIAFVIGLLLSRGGDTSVNTLSSHEKQVIRTRLDTAKSVVTVPLRPIRAVAAANWQMKIAGHDTIFAEACLDTLLHADSLAVAPDTLSICYARGIFSLALGLSPRQQRVSVPYFAHDTFYTQLDTVRVERGGGRAWYEDVLVIVLSVAAGVLVGKL